MKILALSASHETLSLAVNCEEQIFIKEKHTQRNHSSSVLMLIDQLLTESGISINELDCVAFGKGPGSFTGLRVAAGVVQGIAYGIDVPVIPVSCLAALAQANIHSNTLILMNAKREKFYWATCKRNNNNVAELCEGENLTSLNEIQICGDQWHGVAYDCDDMVPDISRVLQSSVIGWSIASTPHAKDIHSIAVSRYNLKDYENAFLALPDYVSPYAAEFQSKAK